MKYFTAIIILAIAISILPSMKADEEIIYIGTAEEFANIREFATGGTMFKLRADIELPSGWQPFVFSGSLNGAGHTVYGGNLFLRVEDAAVSNLIISNANLHVENCKKMPFTGILAGEILRSVIDNVKIEDSDISAKISSPGIVGVGGLAGRISDSTVRNATVTNGHIAVSVTKPDMSKLFAATGGLAGIISGSVVVNCDVDMNITSQGGGTGGFVGMLTNSSRIETSRSYGVVVGENNVGGFAGIISAKGAPNTITDSVAFSPAVIGAGNVRRFAGWLEHEGVNGCHAYLGMAVIAGGKLRHVVPNAFGADGADLRK